MSFAFFIRDRHAANGNVEAARWAREALAEKKRRAPDEATAPKPQTLCRDVECPECGGSGRRMTMVCYGGPPIERWEWCDLCEGEGVICASEQGGAADE